MADEREKEPIFVPMPGRVAIKLFAEDQIGRIVIPTHYQKSRVMGYVLAIGGDETEGEEWDLKIGDLVAFGQNSGVRLSVGRTEVLLVRTSEILCKIQWEGEGSLPLSGEILHGDV